MARYAPLLQISVAHAYYADGRCRGLRFTACAGTLDWLREVDGLCRETGSGLLVLGDRDRLAGNGGGKGNGVSPAVLAWTLHTQDAQFGAVTADLPLLGDELWMLGADDGRLGAVATTSAQRLHAGSTVGAGETWPLTWPTVAAQLGAAQRRPPPLALVRVNAPTAADTAEAPVRYEAVLAARAPVWKYCLVGHWSDDALEVVAARGPMAGASAATSAAASFEAPRAETLPDGRPMLAFFSSAGIELRERSERRFELRTAAAQRVLVKRLPVPGAHSFAKETIRGERTLVSEIYVHR